ncbi:conserved hypothetical protein [Bosea sp. 62]|uniref:peptidylprolyl isomerase n=1 Tax=unclassified Bosea (in: a-proteobacteria) TaxID=2653178 RepID=UPI001258EFC5|nr:MULTISPECIES: peptidylprolyl isomerase [unclassified Bosea (in: a-proteobacteria)]CAD5292830.1 conserved hypothetical protein [Bosea sp. 21B]CAD5293440.1 conserved hypothetical protein [Bosea sp. 46]CAD5299643.1 conserved hypothetical protein [Bosea sp. 7B]VVT62234.1 conserved hypothetical protein [Bosea sp. EC-HK365B]VXB08413.1 conserved hypothetical protein [Bosea sp. 125]
MAVDMEHGDLTRVYLETEAGTIILGIDEARAPLTAANFLAYVDGGFLSDAMIYRIVTLANQAAGTVHPIEVIQFGSPAPHENRAPPLPPVPHEPTSQTGLRHLDGTLSLARNAPGSGGHGFFICIGAQPEVDEGGRRNRDGAGFAAFGKVLSGTEVVRQIVEHAEPTEYMQSPLRVKIGRLS